MRVWLKDRVRKNLAVLLGLIVGLLSAVATDARATLHDDILALQDDVRTLRLTDTIIVNADANFRYVYLRKCQKQGERELFDLAVFSPIEESYVFIPKLCVWMETGHSETERTVRFDKLFFDRLVSQFEELYIYHLHTGIHRELEAYFPAYQDFIAMTLINSQYIDDPRITIMHKIVTGAAIMNYRFANAYLVREKLAKYVEMGLGKFSTQNLSYEYARQSYIDEYINSLKKCVEVSGGDSGNINACNPIVTSLFVVDIESEGALLSMSNPASQKYRLDTPDQHTQ
ncbi:hypothetical protein [Thalassobaculum sp.]|uniref:hypothetical protein n=1 Tax=Thalassobaculum sp. TaxID=2022740 RepID=UPI0032EF8B95